MQKREKKGYALKRQLGLVPHWYDRDSKRFHQGAWKNWSPQEASWFRPDRRHAYDSVMR